MIDQPWSWHFPKGEGLMKRLLLTLAAVLCLGALAGQADASIVFTFTESGGTVLMTPSGTLDTTKLVSVSRPDGWGGTGTEDNPTPGDIDIMGGTDIGGPIDAQFGFNAGTDASAITNPGGPFAFSSFPGITVAGTTAFTTYSGFEGGFRIAGIGMTAADIVAGLWTPDQSWTYGAGETFASLGLNPGTYTVSDIITGESITIQIGEAQAVPEPASMTMLCLGVTGLVGYGWRRRKAL
jgi:hypothetical protein